MCSARMSDQLALLEISERELIPFLKPAIGSRLPVGQNRHVHFPLKMSQMMSRM
jgi:hypothetical protein